MPDGVRVDGADAWSNAARALYARAQRETDTLVDKSLNIIQVEAQRRLSQRTHPAGTRTTSAPGEPPALITGGLRRSFRQRRTRRGPALFEGRIGPTAIQSRAQEFGATIYPKRGLFLAWRDNDGWHRARSVTLPARPFFTPSVKAAVPKIRDLVKATWSRVITG